VVVVVVEVHVEAVRKGTFLVGIWELGIWEWGIWEFVAKLFGIEDKGDVVVGRGEGIGEERREL